MIGAALRAISRDAMASGRTGLCARLASWAHSVDIGAEVAPIRAEARRLYVLERDPSDSRLLGQAWLALGGAQEPITANSDRA